MTLSRGFAEHVSRFSTKKSMAHPKTVVITARLEEKNLLKTEAHLCQVDQTTIRFVAKTIEAKGNIVCQVI